MARRWTRRGGGAVAVALAIALALSAGAAAGAKRGTAGDDRVDLGPGNDRFAALAGDDRVRGGRGADRISGGPGDDRLDGGRGSDRLRGGPGHDICRVDARDRTAARGCERVRGPSPGGGGDPPGTGPPDGGPLPQPPPQSEPQPPAPEPSDAFRNRNWQPTAYDSCPRELHERYSVVGPDGKLYPSWHPPVVTDPATGERCGFGHEHGADPERSDLFAWLGSHLGAAGYEDRTGIPFGYANEELSEYAAANPSVATRFEDHVGHKVDYANDVALVAEGGGYVHAPGPGGQEVRVECDFLTKVHQGSHSPDATANNVHELLYAARCNDGTELISTTMARFGAPNEFNRSCAPGTVVATGSSSPYPPGGGMRLLPDRGCVEQYVLVSPENPSAYSDIWALYENWQSENELVVATGETLARFDPWFAVRNPSRYFWQGVGIGRPLDASWETDPADQGVANRPPWTGVATLAPFEYRDPRSPFDGAQRELYLRETEVTNADGPKRWYTDPYGENASHEPFPGAICQLVGATDNSAYPPLRQRLFGRDDDYGAANGVHAPN